MVEMRYNPNFLMEAVHELFELCVLVPRLCEDLHRGRISVRTTIDHSNCAERAGPQNLVEFPVFRDRASDVPLYQKREKKED